MMKELAEKMKPIMTMTPEIEDYVVTAVNGDPIGGINYGQHRTI